MRRQARGAKALKQETAWLKGTPVCGQQVGGVLDCKPRVTDLSRASEATSWLREPLTWEEAGSCFHNSPDCSVEKGLVEGERGLCSVGEAGRMVAGLGWGQSDVLVFPAHLRLRWQSQLKG